jgi:hypothetical protein
MYSTVVPSSYLTDFPLVSVPSNLSSIAYIRDIVLLDARPLPSSAYAGWKGFDSEVEVEAAKAEPYGWPKLRAVQLSPEVRTNCGGGGL